MFLAILCAILCFAAAIFMLSPYFSKMPLLRPMAFYLIFEGAWHIFTYIVRDLHPTSLVPDYIGRIGTILIILYYLFILVMTRTKSKRKNRGRNKDSEES